MNVVPIGKKIYHRKGARGLAQSAAVSQGDTQESAEQSLVDGVVSNQQNFFAPVLFEDSLHRRPGPLLHLAQALASGHLNVSGIGPPGFDHSREARLDLRFRQPVKLADIHLP